MKKSKEHKKASSQTEEQSPKSLKVVEDLFGIAPVIAPVIPEPPPPPDLFKVILPSLNEKTKHLYDEGILEDKHYPAFIVNKAFSYGVDTILYANEMNRRPDLDKKLNYDFYYHGLDKSKRFNKWIKQQQIEDVEIIMEYFNCSFKKAREYINILTEEQIDTIRTKMSKGVTE